MDYSSDNDSNEELQRDQEKIGPEQFNIVFNNNREINDEDDDIREEKLYFKNREPTFSQTQEEPTIIIEGKENVIIDRISRAFPNLIASAPLQEVKGSVDNICHYIEIIMLVVSISSVIIASLILFICNHLHYMEAKKDIGLIRCLGVKEKESRKFIYFHSFWMTMLSFIFSSAELLIVSLFLSKALSKTLMIESVFVFNPLSFLYMLLVALFISLTSSLFTSFKTSKLMPLECLK